MTLTGSTGRSPSGRTILRLVFLLFCWTLTACPSPEAPAVALVNGEKVHLAELKERIALDNRGLGEGVAASWSAAQQEQFREEILQGLIGEKLLMQRARALSLSVSDAELATRIGELKKDYPDGSFEQQFTNGPTSYEMWREGLRRRLLEEKIVGREIAPAIRVTESEAMAAYRSNLGARFSGRQVRVLQIVVRDPGKLERILNRLNKGEDFGKVARDVSLGPEAARGGDLGFVTPGSMPKEIDTVIFSQPVGRISRVVVSPYGYHIFKITVRQDERYRLFHEVRDQIMQEIRRQKEDEAYRRWMDDLKSKATVSIDRDVLKKLKTVR